MTETIALFGAAGKIGTRIANRLREPDHYDVLYVEGNAAGEARLRTAGLEATPSDDAAASADIIILAVPDTILAPVAASVVPAMKSGAMVICLDPAAPHGDRLPARDDIAYFVVHPCHPPIVNDETDPEARLDFYGGIKAKQSLVCALLQGEEADYARGESVVRLMFAPILRTHRITVEQMAILEPAMAETVMLTCMAVIQEALEETIKRGVPREAAMDFLMGHMNVNIGIQYGYLGDTRFSDGALKMIEQGKEQIFQPDWKKVFEPGNIQMQIDTILAE